MPARRRSIWAALSPFAVLLVGTLAIGTAHAAEGSSAAHGDGKGSAAPESGDHASAKGAGGESSKQGGQGSGQGSGKESGQGSGRESGKGESHASPGGDGKAPQSGSNERSEPARDANPAAQTGKDGLNVEPRLEPLRRLDRKNKLGETPVPRVPGAQGLTRRLSPLPQAPSPVRNSIGVAVPAPARVEPHQAPHLPTLAARPPSVALPAAPGNAGVGPGKPGAVNHPAVNPTIAPAPINRGAINGTGVTRRNVAPPRIGGPVNAVAGINGTAIRSKH